MGRGGWFNKNIFPIIHPNNVEREERQKAEAELNAARQQAAKQQEEAKLHKENCLAKLAEACAQAQEEITNHWQEDIKRAKIYEKLAKRVLNEKLSNSSEFYQTPKP